MDQQCLDQAIAAKIMLARRGIATTVYFGVNSDENGQRQPMPGSQWGTYYVTGGRTRGRFAVINSFADDRV